MNRDFALIMDFDGLIVDTETVEYESWQEIFNEYGCSLSIDKWCVCIGTILDDFDPLDFLAEQVDEPLDRRELHRRQRERFLEAAYSQPLMEGVAETLGEAEKLGVRPAVASSSSRNWVWSHLVPRGIARHFDCIVTSDDVERVKPAPDPYLTALSRMKVPADRAIVLEDSPNGIRAAKAAGIYCVAVPNPITRHLPLDGADRVLRSMKEFSLSDVLKELEEPRCLSGS